MVRRHKRSQWSFWYFSWKLYKTSALNKIKWKQQKINTLSRVHLTPKIAMKKKINHNNNNNNVIFYMFMFLLKSEEYLL